MVVLGKIKSATLVEALVAAVLTVIIFMMASLILNNMVLNLYSKNMHRVEYRLNELEYEAQHTKFTLPYKENFEGWDISLEKETGASNTWMAVKATHQLSQKQIIRRRSYGY